VETLPPAQKTARLRRRLRTYSPPAAAAILCATLALPSAAARTAPLKILLAAPVAPSVQTSMSEALWQSLIAARIDGQVVRFNRGLPNLDDCHKASADYLVTAPFELRPRLPGMPNASGRTAARTHVVVTNCITGDVIGDQVVNLESDPPSTLSAGDIDSEPAIVWSKSVTATLARHALIFPRFARVVHVTPPFALVDIGGLSVSDGEEFQVFASAARQKKGPIELVATQTMGRYVQVLYATLSGGPLPAVGDLVEPAPKPTPVPAASESRQPAPPATPLPSTS